MTKEARVGIMPPKMAKYMNRIDIGIFLSILEICMAEKGFIATRELSRMIPISAKALWHYIE